MIATPPIISTYQQVLKKDFSSNSDRLMRLLDILRDWFSHVVENLQEDLFISPEAMHALLSEVLRFGAPLLVNSKDDGVADATRVAIEAKCDELVADFLTSGRLYSSYVDDTGIQFLGRAVSADRFRTMLEDATGEGDVIYSKLIKREPLEAYMAILPLSYPKQNLWVTWSTDKKDNDPFDFAGDPSAVSYKYFLIKTCLGLDVSADRSDHLLIRFRHQTPRTLLYPTIVDARFYDRFKAARVESDATVRPPNGWTWPRNRDEFLRDTGIKPSAFKSRLPPRPEAIQKNNAARLKDIYTELELISPKPLP